MVEDSPTPKTEAARSSETSITIYSTLRLHIPQDGVLSNINHFRIFYRPISYLKTKQHELRKTKALSAIVQAYGYVTWSINLNDEKG
jgi:hypothetical protein